MVNWVESADAAATTTAVSGVTADGAASSTTCTSYPVSFRSAWTAASPAVNAEGSPTTNTTGDPTITSAACAPTIPAAAIPITAAPTTATRGATLPTTFTTNTSRRSPPPTATRLAHSRAHPVRAEITTWDVVTSRRQRSVSVTARQVAIDWGTPRTVTTYWPSRSAEPTDHAQDRVTTVSLAAELAILEVAA